MPGRRCAVFSCKNTSARTKITNKEIIYHNFTKNKEVRKEWIRRCKRKDKWNPSNSQICSIHFTANDYERDMINELLGLPVRRYLKKSAIPTLNLSQTPKDQKIIAEREERCSKRREIKERKEIIKMLLGEEKTASSLTSPNVDTQLSSMDINTDSSYSNGPEIEHQLLLEDEIKVEDISFQPSTEEYSIDSTVEETTCQDIDSSSINTKIELNNLACNLQNTVMGSTSTFHDVMRVDQDRCGFNDPNINKSADEDDSEEDIGLNSIDELKDLWELVVQLHTFNRSRIKILQNRKRRRLNNIKVLKSRIKDLRGLKSDELSQEEKMNISSDTGTISETENDPMEITGTSENVEC